MNKKDNISVDDINFRDFEEVVTEDSRYPNTRLMFHSATREKLGRLWASRKVKTITKKIEKAEEKLAKEVEYTGGSSAKAERLAKKIDRLKEKLDILGVPEFPKVVEKARPIRLRKDMYQSSYEIGKEAYFNNLAMALSDSNSEKYSQYYKEMKDIMTGAGESSTDEEFDIDAFFASISDKQKNEKSLSEEDLQEIMSGVAEGLGKKVSDTLDAEGISEDEIREEINDAFDQVTEKANTSKEKIKEEVDSPVDEIDVSQYLKFDEDDKSKNDLVETPDAVTEIRDSVLGAFENSTEEPVMEETVAEEVPEEEVFEVVEETPVEEVVENESEEEKELPNIDDFLGKLGAMTETPAEEEVVVEEPELEVVPEEEEPMFTLNEGEETPVEAVEEVIPVSKNESTVAKIDHFTDEGESVKEEKEENLRLEDAIVVPEKEVKKEEKIEEKDLYFDLTDATQKDVNEMIDHADTPEELKSIIESLDEALRVRDSSNAKNKEMLANVEELNSKAEETARSLSEEQEKYNSSVQKLKDYRDAILEDAERTEGKTKELEQQAASLEESINQDQAKIANYTNGISEINKIMGDPTAVRRR